MLEGAALCITNFDMLVLCAGVYLKEVHVCKKTISMTKSHIHKKSKSQKFSFDLIINHHMPFLYLNLQLQSILVSSYKDISPKKHKLLLSIYSQLCVVQ